MSIWTEHKDRIPSKPDALRGLEAHSVVSADMTVSLSAVR